MKKLTEILRKVPFYTCKDSIDHIEVNGIEMDHRKVKNNHIFICIKGYTVDGHDYAELAVENGAVVVIAERQLQLNVPVIVVGNTSKLLPLIAATYYQNPSRHFPLIGVTGTNGKTTVTHLIDEMFQATNKKTGIIGTIEMRINNKVTEVKNTTPDSLFLQESFEKMRLEAVDVGIMEVSSHALDQGRVNGADFDIAIFTNLTQDHLDYHKTMDHYLFAKSLLFAQLGNDYTTNKYAVINIDDENSAFISRATAQPIITYAINQKADFYATNIQLKSDGTDFIMHTPIGKIEITSKLMGNFSIYNMLAASAAAYCSNIELDVIKHVLNHTSGVRGRFEPILNDKGFGVIVDYAHTPDSLENVLKTAKGFCNGKIFAIVGCGGDRDKTKRPLMANVACEYADTAIFTSDNPRSEDPQAIITDMIEDIKKENYQVIIDRYKAIEQAINQAKPNDIVLIAGKGHETYQIIGDTVHDFDDAEVARQLLNK